MKNKKTKAWTNIVPIHKNAATPTLAYFGIPPHSCPNCRSKKVELDTETIYQNLDEDRIILPLHCEKCKFRFREVYQYQYTMESENQ